MIIHCDTTRYIWEVLEHGEYGFAFDDLVVMDLGCNIGAFSLWIYPRARVIHAIDMEPKFLDLFKKTIRDNELTGIILYKEKITDGLADFMGGHNIATIDVLKLDVEGDEIALLAAPDFPVDKIFTIVGEYHEKPVKDILERIGYKYTEYPNSHFLARRI